MAARDRKADAREKIELGGLVLKAGLGRCPGVTSALILGILLDGVARLAQPGERERLERIGHAGFGKAQG